MTVIAAYSFLEAWAAYDPKEAAVEKLTQCLHAESSQQELNCGIIMNSPCWNAIKESFDKPHNSYSVEVLWYNWEDQIPNRGGDEVYLELRFEDGNVFRILWYEGGLEYCETP